MCWELQRGSQDEGAGDSHAEGFLYPATERVMINLSLHIETSRASLAYVGLEEEGNITKAIPRPKESPSSQGPAS